MISNSLRYLNIGKQATKEGSSVNERELLIYVTDIILEYAKRNADHWVLYADELPYQERKIFLSKLISANQYADFTSNHVREQAAIDEYLDEMQWHINDRIDEVFEDHMDDCGMRKLNCHNTGEVLWIRR